MAAIAYLRDRKLIPIILVSFLAVSFTLVYIGRLKNVTLLADGKVLHLRTARKTVSQVLKEVGLEVDADDIINPPGDALVYSGIRIELVRYTEKIVKERQFMPYKIQYADLYSLPMGKTMDIRSGLPGVKEVLVKVRYRDGVETGREILEKRTIARPVDRIVIRGVSRRDRMEGLRKRLSGKNYLTMRATAYYPGHISTAPFTDGYTAIGLKAGFGVAAVDPRYIPLGTKLYVEGYGYAIAADVGGAIRGYRIDLGFDDYESAINYGHRKVKVYILEEEV